MRVCTCARVCVRARARTRSARIPYRRNLVPTLTWTFGHCNPPTRSTTTASRQFLTVTMLLFPGVPTVSRKGPPVHVVVSPLPSHALPSLCKGKGLVKVCSLEIFPGAPGKRDPASPSSPLASTPSAVQGKQMVITHSLGVKGGGQSGICLATCYRTVSRATCRLNMMIICCWTFSCDCFFPLIPGTKWSSFNSRVSSPSDLELSEAVAARWYIYDKGRPLRVFLDLL